MSGVPDYGAMMDAEAAAAPGVSADPVGPVINEASPAAKAPTGVPDYGAMMDQEAAGAARLGYHVAQGTDPDQYARAQQLARELGVPTQTALADAEALQRKRAAGEIDFDRIAREQPQTANLLADPERAKVAHDDVPGLQAIETAAKGWGQSFADAPAELVKGLGGSFNRAAGSVNLLLGAAPVIYDKAASLLTGRVHTEASDAWFGHMVQPVIERQPQFEPDRNAAFPEKLANTLGSLAGTLSQITLSGTTAAPATPAALGLPAMQEVVGGAVQHGTKAMLFPAASDAADTARQVYAETGGDAGAAIRAAEAKYATTSAMGVLPLSAPGGAFARIGSGAVAGVAGGEAGRVVNNLALPDQMQTTLSAEDLALQAVTGSVLAIGGPRGANAARLHAARVESAKRASQGAALLAQLNKLAEASKVRARDPAQAQAFFQSLLNEGRDAVWISPKALAESGLSERIIAEIPGVAEQVRTAVDTQHDIRLPVADLMARMAGPELEQGILPHVSTEPGGFTAKTAEAYYQTGAAAELQAEVARVLGDDAAARPFKASAERVKTAILADLAAAGRHPGAHDVYATLVSQFYAVQAARLGTTPEALYKDYPIRVTARSGTGEVFEQDTKWSIYQTLSYANDAGGAGMVLAVTRRLLDATPEAEADVVSAARDLGYDLIRESGSDLSLVERPQNPGVGLTVQTGAGDQDQSAGVSVAARDGSERGTSDRYQRGVELPEAGSIYGKSASVGVGSHDELGPRFPEARESEITDDSSITDFIEGSSKWAYVAKRDNEIPDGWYVHGRQDRKDLNTGNVIQMTRDWDVAEQYSGRRGSQWLIRPAENATVFDLSEKNSSDMDRVVDEAIKQWEKGEFEIAYDIEASLGREPDEYDIEDAIRDSFAPENIVDSAGAYDNLAWARWLHDTFDVDFVNTPDGAVAFDSDAGVDAVRVPDKHEIEPQKYNQGVGSPRGSFSPDTLTITLHQGADLSTFLHETGHAFLELQTQLAARIAHEADGFGGALSAGERELIADTNALLRWFGVRDLDTWHAMPFEERRSHHEQFARGFEVYLHEGKAPSLELAGVFQRFRAYLLGVYRNLLDTNLDAQGKRQGLGVGLKVELTDEVRGVMDRMIASGDQIQAAEQGRALMPLFARADQAGMTVDEFRDYQALGIDATNTAIDDLQARGVRDLQWIDRARGRMVRQLQREASGLRAQAQMDARRELLSQPIYQAWQFLTNRIGADDMLPAAVARADYLTARKAWNADLATWEAQALIDAKQAAWEGSVEGQVKYRRKATLERAQRKVAKREAGAIAADLDARRAEWKAAHPAPVESGQAPKVNTGTLDPERDSLFKAIGKLGGLNKNEVISTWGTDPADAPKSGVFGKPVWRREGGRSIDGMVEALSAEGYLETDEHGKSTAADLERAFNLELRGSPQHSNRYDPDLAVDGGGPDYVVNPQALGAGRINRAALSDLLTDSASDPADSARIMAALDAAKMVSNKGGLHPDVVADLVPGLHSGEELVRALADATPLKEALTARTDALMLERHGDLATPQALAEAADRAIFNDVRARLVTVEANALAKATGRPQILTRAAQEFAGAMVARLRVRDIRPDLYAAGAARAGKSAAKASQSGDLATAAAEKRNQVILIHATKAAHEAKANAEGVRRKLSKFARAADNRLKGTYDLDLVNAVRAIVGQYGIAPGKTESASAYVARLKDYDPDTHASIIEQVQAAEANARPFRDLTVDDVRALKDVTDDLLHLAKQSHRIEVDGALMSRKSIEAKLLERLTAKGIPEHMPGETSAVTPAEARLARFQEAKAFLSLVEFWAMRMDGTMADIGPFRRYIFNLVKGRADAYRADQARVMGDLKGLLDGIAPTLKPILIHSPELNYTFGKDKSGAGMNEIVHALLHTGNGSNRRKLLLGRGWAEQRADGTLDTSRWDAFIARMIAEGKITQAHYDFAQGVWDLNEGMKPLAQKAHRDVFGRYFDEITAEPVSTPFGEYRGGYVPAQVDTRIVKDLALKKLVEEENANLAFAMPSTPRGFTKGRVEYNRPLLLDLRALSQHINQVLLFSHLEVPIRGVNRLLKGIGEPLNRVDPAAINGMLTPWLAVTARQQVVTPISADAGISRIATLLRQRAGAAAMAGNLLNGFQQLFTGFPMAARRVGWGPLLKAAGHYMRNPAAMVRAVSAESAYMDGRLNDLVHSMSDDIHEILINPGRLERAQDWTMRHSYFFQRGVDLVTSPITWTASYNKAMAEGKSTADAKALADSTVRTSQGSFLPEDVARVATGTAWWRAATQFADYFTMWRESIETELVTADRRGGPAANAGRKAEILLLSFLVPAVVGELVAQGFRGGPADDDHDGEIWDDWLKQVFVVGPLKNAAAMIPILGPSLVAGANAFNDKPYDDRMATSPTVGMIESSVKGAVALPKLLTPEELTLRNVRDMGTLVSMALGLPGTIISRPLGYLVGVENDRIRPTSNADAVRGVLTGVASPDSKR